MNIIQHNEATPLLSVQIIPIEINDTNDNNSGIVNSENDEYDINDENNESDENDGNDVNDDEHDEHDQNLCWICRENMRNEEQRSFCNCNGFISFVHYDCLNEWIQTSNKTRCDFCHHEYNYDFYISWKLFFQNIHFFIKFNPCQYLILPLVSLLLILTFFPNNIIGQGNTLQKIITSVFLAYLFILFLKFIRKQIKNARKLTLVPID